MNVSICHVDDDLEKKQTPSESWELFSLGQNEDWKQGDRTSDSSEKLFQRCRGLAGGRHICDFGKGGIRAIRHIFFQKVSTSLMKLLLVTRNSD